MKIDADHLGFCPNCLVNVEHVRIVKSAVLQFVDRASFRIPELFGIGPWFCTSCGKRRLLFPPFRRNAISYNPNLGEAEPVSELDTESVGNVYFSEISLVHRSNRAKFYTEKFRDGIVERLLNGSTTFSQVRQSLGITDLDLQDWISRYHQNRVRLTAIRIASAVQFDAIHADTANPVVDRAADPTGSDEPFRANVP
jgi:hypothetical protein